MKSTVILIFILLLGVVLRFYNLGVVPPGPNWDEAALGYNAYSILKTGKDEYGISFPLSLRSFDDYKPPLYMYVTIPSIRIFGLNLWAVRLPSVILGLFAILGTFFLIKSLIYYSPKFRQVYLLPFLGSLLLAISPWHLQFSRMAFEANLGITLTIWAVVFFFWGFTRGIFFSISALFFSLTIYAYHSQRVFSPLLVFLLGVVFFKSLQTKKMMVFLAIIVGVLAVLPLFSVLTDSTTLTRLKGTSALADQTKLLERSAYKLRRDRESGNIVGMIFDNRRVVFIQKLLEGYVSHYSLNWLFIQGDNARHHAPGMGLLYLVELPFFLLGLFVLARHGNKMKWVVFGWMCIAPIAASPTTELPHSIRTLVFLPSFQIVIALGLWRFLEYTRKQKNILKIGLPCVLLSAGVLNFTYYLDQYFVQQNREFSKYWQYGYKDAVSYAKAHYSEYEKIVVSTKLEQPHMFFLFFLQYDPEMYLSEGGTRSGGFEEVKNRFDKYEFRSIYWENELHDGKTLYVGTPGEIHGNLKKIIYFLNGEEAIKIAI